MRDLAGKTAAITGGASGIGYGLAEAFAARDMTIALLDIEASALEKAVARLTANGAKAQGFVADVTDLAAMKASAKAITDAFGRVNILCNNAGVGVADPLQIARDEDWNWLLAVNLKGVINGLQAFLPDMIAHGEAGHIINTASVAGLHAMPQIGIYNTTKYAVVGLTETLRDDLSDTMLGVSCLCPGYVNTNINQSRRNRHESFGRSEPPRISQDVMQKLDRDLKTRGLAPRMVGEMVVDALERELFYIVTDAGFWPQMRRRFEEVAADTRALHGGLPGAFEK